MRTSILTLVAIVALLCGKINAEALWCNASDNAGATADLYGLAATKFQASLVGEGTVTNVTLAMGFCAGSVNVSTCNSTGSKAALTSASGCVDVFDTIFWPLHFDGSKVTMKFWSTRSTAVMFATVTCDASVPSGAAWLTGFISHPSVAEYRVSFASSAACAV